MAESAYLKLDATVSNGPSLSENVPATVEAYDQVSVSIDPGAGPIEVQLQPASSAVQVRFLALKSSHYDELITYTINADATSITLDGPLLLGGSGAVSLLDSAGPPQTIHITNGSDKKIVVTVLIGRDATPGV